MAKLCKCNNCGSILLDENPQTDAKEYDLKKLNFIPLSMEYLQVGENDFAWVCPKCKTDGFLVDEI